ncbi:MAG: hypothetical protein AB7X49_14170 [Geminicoccaceae bacterium]
MPTAAALEVLDASALAALLFGEPETTRVAERLNSARLVAPENIASLRLEPV